MDAVENGTEASRPAVGVDAGATLAKLAVRTRSGGLERTLLAARDTSAIVEAVAERRPGRVGLTGGGAARLAELLGARGIEAVRVNEFAAWGAGAAHLSAEQELRVEEPYLLVSLGTGTSAMLVDGLSVSRVGGTALGGGTVVGLAALLLGEADFTSVAELAARGDRRRVDLLVSDIYGPGEFPLARDLTAANFGRLGRPAGERACGGPGEASAPDRPAPEDLAHAVMGLVGENVALVCAGLCAARQVRRVVFAGSTLRGNAALREVLGQITSALGAQVLFLDGGEFAGAVGALQLARGA